MEIGHYIKYAFKRWEVSSDLYPKLIIPTTSIASCYHSPNSYHVLSLQEKKEDECFDRRKIYWNNETRGCRSAYDKFFKVQR